MAVALAVLTNAIPNPYDATQQECIVDGTVTFSGSYTTGGDVASLAGLCPVSNQIPNRVEVFQVPVAGATPAPYTVLYGFNSAPTPANGVLLVIDNTTGVQVAGTTYNSALTTGTPFHFRAWFPRL